MSPIDDKYAQLGGPSGFLGAPQTPELTTPNGLGSYRHYAGGSIYWKHVLPLAYEVHGLIRDKWASMGWENSVLGFPTTDETSVGGGRGRANTFESGVISWTPNTGAHEVHGAINGRWGDLGREGGLGFPLTDELVTPDTRGRYNHFENGSIYWTPTTGAHEVTGNIKADWAAAGWEQSPVGYPVAAASRMQPNSVPCDFQDFEHGSIYDWLTNSLIVTRNSSVVAITGNLIDWSAFPNPMADGDRISASFSGHPPSGNTQLTLVAGPGITWWKAVSIWSPSRGDLTQDAWTQDTHTSTTISIPATLLEPSDVFIQFKKAKFLGVHTGMYWLSRADRLIGSNVTFTWLKD
jgi:uncharacterized protein with LGFP repeats